MTAKEIEEGFREIWELFKETDREIKATSQEVKAMSRKVEETSRAVEALTGKWGKFVEGLLLPAVERLFTDRGIDVDKVYPRAKVRKNGDSIEIDILAIDGEYAVLIEAKSTLGVADIDEHLQRLQKFKTFYPEYADRKVVGAVAGIVIEEDADRSV